MRIPGSLRLAAAGVCLVLALILCGSFPVFASTAGITIQGVKVPLPDMLQHRDGDLFVPFSALAGIRGMNALQDYQGRVYRLAYRDHTVLLSPNVFAFNVDGQGQALVNAPRMIENELYVPIKPVARTLGLTITRYTTGSEAGQQPGPAAPAAGADDGGIWTEPTDELGAPHEVTGVPERAPESFSYDEQEGMAVDDTGVAEAGWETDDEGFGDFGSDFQNEFQDNFSDGFGGDAAEALVRVNIYSEMAGQEYRTDGVLNRDNRFMFNRFRFYNRGFLTVKSSFGGSAGGFLQLEGLYVPVDFYLNSFKNGATGLLSEDASSRELEVSVKALYIDQLTRYFTLRLGKQFIKWGSSTFFTPLDVINYERDPLRPIEEAEGNPFIHFTFPFDTNFSFELLGVVLPDDLAGKTESTGEMPVVPKVSLSMGNFSMFLFSRLQQHHGPYHGVDANCVFPIGEYSDLTVFTQALFKPRSGRVRFAYDRGTDTYAPEMMNESSYRSLLAGFRFQHTFTDLEWLERLNLSTELYYDNENWEHEHYRNYLGYLEQEEHRFNEVFPRYNIFDKDWQFRNSTRYLFTNLTFRSLLKEDFQLGMSLVLNVDDASYLLIPDLSYTFSNNNATTGLKANFFRGESDTEFGSHPLDHQLFYYLSYAY